MSVSLCHYKGLVPHEFFDVKDRSSLNCQPRGEGVAKSVEGDSLTTVRNPFVPF